MEEERSRRRREVEESMASRSWSVKCCSALKDGRFDFGSADVEEAWGVCRRERCGRGVVER